MNVTLNIPDLFATFREINASDIDRLNLDRTVKILSRASAQAIQGTSCERWLYEQFSPVTTSTNAIPVASMTAIQDGLNGTDGYWMRADPVYLHPDTHSLILQDPTQLDLRSDEVECIYQAILPLFADYGVTLHVPHMMRWYLKFKDVMPDIACTPLHEVLMKPVDRYLPKGRDSRKWHTLFNEIQMVLAALETNQQRQARQQPPVNSLWFWGPGAYPDLRMCPYDCCMGDDDFLQTLCFATGSHVQSINSGMKGLHHHHNVLMVYEKFHQARQLDNPACWLDALKDCEIHIFQPLYTQLKSGQIKTLMIISDDKRYDCTPGRLRKFWKRSSRPSRLWL